MMDDVPPHLMQPLSVDTNITYNLDMTMFPGLDDPQQMYQPALFVATDWSQYIADDVVETELDATDDQDDDLFSLLESSDILTDLDTTTSGDSEAFQSFIDDVIGTDSDPNESCFILDSTDDSQSTVEIDLAVSGNILPEASHVHSMGGQKRKRTISEDYPEIKKSRTSDTLSLEIPSFVSVCPTSTSCDVQRDS